MKKIYLFCIILILFAGCGRQTRPSLTSQEEFEVFYRNQADFFPVRKQIIPPRRTPFISIAAVGDIMLGSHVIAYLNQYGSHYPFDSTKTLLEGAHIAIGNLEAPFGLTGKKFEKEFNFKVPPRHAKGLVEAGFDVVNLANNHIMDFGTPALVSTLRTLDSLGIRYSGAGMTVKHARQPAIIEKNGVKTAFLGCSMTFPSEFWATRDSAGTYYPNEANLTEQIAFCEKNADITVVSFHWGQEKKDSPRDYQTYFAHLAIDAGADLILGHHAHVLQGIELYQNRLIIYGLGNFAFGSYSAYASESIILKVYLTSEGLLFARVYPLSVKNAEVAFQPRVLSGNRATSLISRLNLISAPLNGERDIIDENGLIWGNWILK